MPLFVYLVFVIILLFEVPQIEIDIKCLYITKICSELKRDADTNILNTKIYLIHNYMEDNATVTANSGIGL